MSSYEQYDITSANYDLTRQPVGLATVLGTMAVQGAAVGRPLADLEVLDAGCGTGNYLQAVVPHVARVTGVDASHGMLERAADKLRDEIRAGRVTLSPVDLTELPFADASFDVAMVNQVLHHLPDDPDGDRPLLRAVLGQLARVLRPGGTLVVTTCSPQQIDGGYWYYDLIRPAADRLRARYAPLDVLAALMAEVGLGQVQRTVPLDAVVQGDAYFASLGPLDPSWRDGDSVWSLASETEVSAAQDRLRRLDVASGARSYVMEQDAARGEVGQLTVVSAVKR